MLLHLFHLGMFFELFIKIQLRGGLSDPWGLLLRLNFAFLFLLRLDPLPGKGFLFNIQSLLIRAGDIDFLFKILLITKSLNVDLYLHLKVLLIQRVLSFSSISKLPRPQKLKGTLPFFPHALHIKIGLFEGTLFIPQKIIFFFIGRGFEGVIAAFCLLKAFLMRVAFL